MFILLPSTVEANFIAPPQNMTVTRGSNVTISCGHVIAWPEPVTWLINGTSFTPEEIFFSQLYQRNRQGIPTENSLTVFSINGTTTFQCVVHSNPAITSTLGTINVIGMYAYTYMILCVFTCRAGRFDDIIVTPRYNNRAVLIS